MMYKTIIFLVLFLTIGFPYNIYGAQLKKEKEFIVMEEVYPYTEPIILMEKIDTLIGKNHSVIIGVMPIYENTNYPAMIEFTEVIKYAQSIGCPILLHFPIIQKSDVQTEEILSILNEQTTMYSDFGVNIRGILMGSDDLSINVPTDVINMPVFNLKDINLEYYDKDIKESFPIFNTNELKDIFYSYTPTNIPTDFDFERSLLDNISVDLENQNKILIVMVIVWVSVFVAMIYYARRKNKNDFIKKGDK